MSKQQKYKPLSDRVIVKPSESEQTTKSGIVLPDSAKEKSQEGVVVSVGPGRLTEDGKPVPMTVKEGDYVIFSKYGGTEIELENEDHLIIKQEDLLAVAR